MIHRIVISAAQGVVVCLVQADLGFASGAGDAAENEAGLKPGLRPNDPPLVADKEGVCLAVGAHHRGVYQHHFLGVDRH